MAVAKKTTEEKVTKTVKAVKPAVKVAAPKVETNASASSAREDTSRASSSCLYGKSETRKCFYQNPW